MIGFIGCGNMAEALIKGLVQGPQSAAKEILGSEPNEERRKYIEQSYGIRTGSNRQTASLCDIIILAVKPQNMPVVLDEITSEITEEKTVVSIAAGISISYLQSKLRTRKLIRVMPNTPALIQKGMSVMSFCECFDDRDIAFVRDIFMSVGKVITLPEKYMNAVTALSGSGPAFFAFFTEAVIEAGVHLGLGKADSFELAVQTFIGTAGLLETGMPPDKLREMVTSPGGTTAAGLKAFKDKGLEDLTTNALKAALCRAEELGRRE